MILLNVFKKSPLAQFNNMYRLSPSTPGPVSFSLLEKEPTPFFYRGWGKIQTEE